MSVEAVIFDFGGVISSSPFEAFARFEAARGLPKDFLRTVNATNAHDNAWARLERSELDVAGFDAAFAAESRALGHEVIPTPLNSGLHALQRTEDGWLGGVDPRREGAVAVP